MGREVIFTEQEVIDLIISLNEANNTDITSSVGIINEAVASLRKKIDVPEEVKNE